LNRDGKHLLAIWRMSDYVMRESSRPQRVGLVHELKPLTPSHSIQFVNLKFPHHSLSSSKILATISIIQAHVFPLVVVPRERFVINLSIILLK
jgi:hypothetical protein